MSTLRFYTNIKSKKSNMNLDLSSKSQRPIISLDCSWDGQMVLVTFEDKILVVFTKMKNGKSLFSNKILEKQRESQIRIVELKAHNWLNWGRMIPARFGKPVKGQDPLVVGGFGKYLIFWKLCCVSEGEVQAQKQLQLKEQLIQAEFINQNSRVVVMTANSIEIG